MELGDDDLASRREDGSLDTAVGWTEVVVPDHDDIAVRQFGERGRAPGARAQFGRFDGPGDELAVRAIEIQPDFPAAIDGAAIVGNHVAAAGEAQHVGRPLRIGLEGVGLELVLQNLEGCR